tara:strand:- start:212 stop:490 length:279 start_codon:yes stop_codon:yes gene_type:complete
MLKRVARILKDNENKLVKLGLADGIEGIDYELKYNPYTKRNMLLFFDNDSLNGNAKRIINFIAKKLSEDSNRIFNVYEKQSNLYGCLLYKVE